jgi:GntR family transcriptional regulator
VPAKKPPRSLDRSSFVPLYYQLQEILKQDIEAGRWGLGERLPSEPELADSHGVSRVVVRRALAILADDRQIERLQGRGTYVARPKVAVRPGGLSRLLAQPREERLDIVVLDQYDVAVSGHIRENLQVERGDEALRVTTRISLDGLPLAICYSYFADAYAELVRPALRVGHEVERDWTLADLGLALGGSRVDVETSFCGPFEAQQFGIPYHSSVFLVLCMELPKGRREQPPIEVARVEYRGDLVQFSLNVEGRSGNQDRLTWSG